MVSWDTDNSSCNGLLNITNTTVTDTWNVTLTNVTDGIEYRIYNSTEYMLDSAIASSGSAILEFTGIEDGIYKIVELSNPQLLWTYWHPENSNPTGIVEISQSSGYNYINFTISNPTTGATYWLYNPETLELLDNGTKYINVTGLTDGTYNIIKTGVGESMTVDLWDRSNASAIGIFTLYNSTIFSNWNFKIHNAVPYTTYMLHELNGTDVIASAVTSNGFANITATGLSDSTKYRISERGPPHINFVQWDNLNKSAIGVFDIINSTPTNVWNFTLHGDGSGNEYIIYSIPNYTVIDRASITSADTLISTTNLLDGRYYIAKTGTEKIIIESWTPDSEDRIGKINITDSTMFSVWKFIIHNTGSGHTYKLIDSNNEEVVEAITIRGDATLTATGLPDGIYYVYLKNAGYQSYVKPALILGSLITISYVLASTFNRRRKHE